MSTPRKVGVFLCLASFVAVCVLAIVLPTPRPFAGLAGIEEGLEDQAAVVVARAVGVQAAELDDITASGRDLEVQLPDTVNVAFDRDQLQADLSKIDGVRKVELIGIPTILGAQDESIDVDTAPEPTQVVEPTVEPTVAPTVAPTAAPTAVPTEEPEPAEPTPDPNAAAEPTAEAEPEPTATPEPVPTATPIPKTIVEVVADIDLAPVTFVGDTARLTAQDIATLDTVADQLQGLSGGPIQVQAHTNNTGDPDVNLLLSQDRAQAVRNYLIERGVDSSLLTARGFGASAPISSNSTEQGRAANQRVELVVEGN